MNLSGIDKELKDMEFEVPLFMFDDNKSVGYNDDLLMRSWNMAQYTLNWNLSAKLPNWHNTHSLYYCIQDNHNGDSKVNGKLMKEYTDFCDIVKNLGKFNVSQTISMEIRKKNLELAFPARYLMVLR